MRGKKIKFGIAIAVIGGTVAFLMVGKLKDAFRFSEGVDVVASGAQMVGRAVRIQGKYIDDSLVKKRENGKAYFELGMKEKEGEAQLTLRYDELLPDTLVNGSEVTAEGTLEKPGYFRATKIFAKCPSRYDMMKMPPGYKPPHASDPYAAAGRSVPSVGPGGPSPLAPRVAVESPLLKK